MRFVFFLYIFLGTGASVLSFCPIPSRNGMQRGHSNTIEKNTGEFAIRNARGHYVVLRKDGTLGVQREPDVDTEIAFHVSVHRNSIRLAIGK